MKRYDPVFFDWDGCLARTLDPWLIALRTAYNHYGAYPDDHEIGHNFGDWNSAAKYGITDRDGFDQILIDTVYEELKTVELYEGARDLLVKLKDEGRTLALLSSSERKVLEWGLAHNRLEGLFDLVIAGDEVKAHKPDPEVIDRARDAFGAERDTIVMIGDSRKDLEAATRAGVDSVLIHHPGHENFYDIEVLREYNPTHEVRSMAELEQLLG